MDEKSLQYDLVLPREQECALCQPYDVETLQLDQVRTIRRQRRTGLRVLVDDVA